MNRKEFLNLEIGKKFTLGYREYEVVKADRKDCSKCAFYKFNCISLLNSELIPLCGREREGAQKVMFVEVEE